MTLHNLGHSQVEYLNRSIDFTVKGGVKRYHKSSSFNPDFSALSVEIFSS